MREIVESEETMSDEKPTTRESEEDIMPVVKPSIRLQKQVSSFSEADAKKSFVFSFMADYPWPFMLLIPLAFLFIIGFGWTKEDMVQNEIDSMWVEEKGNYARDLKYAMSVGAYDVESAMLAMAVSRDGQNIMTADRLEEIRDRMEKTEGTMVRFITVLVYLWRPFVSFLFLLQITISL